MGRIWEEPWKDEAWERALEAGRCGKSLAEKRGLGTVGANLVIREYCMIHSGPGTGPSCHTLI